MSDLQRLDAWVTGRVQGVGFRMFVQEQAERLGLSGQVYNDRSDRRRLHVIAEGSRAGLEALLDALRSGPPAARVEAVQAGWEAGQGNFTGFRVVV